VPADVESRAIARVAVVVGVAAAIVAAYARYASPYRPGVSFPRGFYGYYDQGAYLRLARVLAHIRLPGRPEYQFGLGYPVLGAVFSRLGFRGDPFAPVDVLCFGATTGLTVVLGARAAALFAREHALALGVAAAGLLLLATGILSMVAIPWNSNIVLTLGVLILVLVTSARPISPAGAAVIGASIGWIFAARYADALFFGIPVAGALVARPPRERRQLVLFGGAAAAAVVGLVLFTQYHAFGNPFTTPYHSHFRRGLGSDQSLSNYRIGWIPTHFWSTFVTGRLGSARQSGSPILLMFPLLPLAPIGMVLLARSTRDRVRIVWVTAAVASGVSALFYLAFVAGGAGDIKFGNPRYWAVWYPLWSVLVVTCIAIFVRYVANYARKPEESASQHSAASDSRTPLRFDSKATSESAGREGSSAGSAGKPSSVTHEVQPP